MARQKPRGDRKLTRGPPLLCQQGLRGRGRRRSTRPRRARRERWGRVRARCTMCGTRRRRGRGAGVGAPEGGSALLRTGSCELSGWLRAEDLLKIATLVGGAEVGGRQRGWAGPGGKRGRTCGGSPRAQALETRRPGRRRPGWGTRGAGTPGHAAEAREEARGAGGPRKPPWVERRRAQGWTSDSSESKDRAT